MLFPIYLAVLVALVIAGLLVLRARRWFAKRRREQLYQQPISPEWQHILQNNVALYELLSPALKSRLHGHINFFLADKEFVGCDGQAINDEIRLTIAGNACLLVLQRDARIFPGFKTILVYPNSYVAQQQKTDGSIQEQSHSLRAGESWHRGPIVLSWADVLHGSKNDNDGHNVVLHEFAHKLDEENTVMDGLPILRDSSHYAQWSLVLNKEYDAFLKRVSRHKNTVIDEYGAVSAVEFFAVIAESFFEKPVQMKEKLPELYAQLQRYFQLDPAAWRRR